MKNFFKRLAVLLIACGCIFSLSACGLFSGWQNDSGGSENSGSSSGNNSSNSNSGSNNNSGNSGGSNSGNGGNNVVIITTPPEPHTFNVRTETVTITDSGRKNQQMDKVLLSNYYNVVQLYKNGYTKIHVTFSFDVKEIDDGYQYVFLYSDANCRGNGLLDKIGDALGGFLGSSDSDDPSLLYVYKFEHGAGKKDTSWKTHTFTTTLSTGSLKDDLYIRYGASGKNDDDWQNKNVTVYVELSN